jgi:hypothetical protein
VKAKEIRKSESQTESKRYQKNESQKGKIKSERKRGQQVMERQK